LTDEGQRVHVQLCIDDVPIGFKVPGDSTN
jgi:hypothetical protein